MNVGPVDYKIMMQGGSSAFKCPVYTRQGAEDGGLLPPDHGGDATVSSRAYTGANESARASTSESSSDETMQTMGYWFGGW